MTPPDTVRVLLVEDEPELARALREGLGAYGFALRHAPSAEAAWALLWQHPFDVLLLDVGLPEGDDAGFELAERLRDAGFRQPLLFLTAREGVPDRVRGLEVGDDYLPKPFALQELRARLKALSRRGEVRSRVIRWGELEVESEGHRVTRAGTPVRLTAKEFEVLELLVRAPGRVFARDEILERIWGLAFDPPSNLVDVYVSNLRRKLGDGVIETVRGVGYRLPERA